MLIFFHHHHPPAADHADDDLSSTTTTTTSILPLNASNAAASNLRGLSRGSSLSNSNANNADLPSLRRSLGRVPEWLQSNRTNMAGNANGNANANVQKARRRKKKSNTR